MYAFKYHGPTRKLSELIHIDELENLLPYLPEHYKELKTSIEHKGVRQPIVIDSSNFILDGYHRVKAAEELGMEVVPVIVDRSVPPQSDSKDQHRFQKAKALALSLNIKRRQLNEFQLVESTKELLEIQKELAKARMEKREPTKFRKTEASLAQIGASVSPTTLTRVTVTRDGVPPETEASETGKATAVIANKLGMSTRQYEKVMTIINKGSEDVKDKVRNGLMSVNAAYDFVLTGGKESAKEPKCLACQGSGKKAHVTYETCQTCKGTGKPIDPNQGPIESFFKLGDNDSGPTTVQP